MDEWVSKSQKKREAEALQKIGTELIGLSNAKLDRLPLSDALKRAVVEAKALKSHGAVKRQGQLIGKLLRTDECDDILAAYADLLAEDNAQSAKFHSLEIWRERLIRDGKDALTAFIEEYHPDDVQQLRQLIKKAVDEQSKEKSTGASKALFRHLRLYL